MQLDETRVVTQASVDNYAFKLTRERVGGGECYILWLNNAATAEGYQALGTFASFDRHHVLDFVVRYVTRPALREELARRRFARYIESLSPDFFDRFHASLAEASEEEKILAFEGLFDLDSVIDAGVDLSWKRRYMANKFHPDKGGDHLKMALINEGYRLLKSSRRSTAA